MKVKFVVQESFSVTRDSIKCLESIVSMDYSCFICAELKADLVCLCCTQCACVLSSAYLDKY